MKRQSAGKVAAARRLNSGAPGDATSSVGAPGAQFRVKRGLNRLAGVGPAVGESPESGAPNQNGRADQ